MKILAFTDLHASLDAFESLKKKIKKSRPDALVCAGDLTIFEDSLLYILREFNRFKIPFITIHGNHETSSKMSKYSKKLKYIKFIHKIHHIIDNCVFLGFGGGGFAKTEPQLKKISGKFKRIIEKNKDKKIIFITHAPPYKTKLDKLEKNAHCGNKTIRSFIKKNRIDYALSGHIHENQGKKDKIKNCIVINPGPKGRIINL